MPLYNNYAKLIKKRIITTIYNEIIRIQRECDKENVYKKNNRVARENREIC